MKSSLTVIELQDRLAKMFGKEAALFVASGTMANAIALRTHTVPGDEIVCDKTAHIYKYEGGNDNGRKRSKRSRNQKCI